MGTDASRKADDRPAWKLQRTRLEQNVVELDVAVHHLAGRTSHAPLSCGADVEREGAPSPGADVGGGGPNESRRRRGAMW